MGGERGAESRATPEKGKALIPSLFSQDLQVGSGGHNSHPGEHIWAHSCQNVLGQGSREKRFSVSAPKSAAVGADEAVLGGQEAKGSLEGSCPFPTPGAPHGTAGEERSCSPRRDSKLSAADDQILFKNAALP